MLVEPVYEGCGVSVEFSSAKGTYDSLWLDSVET